MTITRQQEIWAMALWVEKQHGADGQRSINRQIALLEKSGEERGTDLWKAVKARFEKLRRLPIPIDGQPSTKPN